LLLAWLALNLHPVGLWQLVFRVSNACLQTTVIGQQQQPFAVAIQTTGRIHPGDVDKVTQGCAPISVGELGQHIKGFVQRNQARLGRRRRGFAANALRRARLS